MEELLEYPYDSEVEGTGSMVVVLVVVDGTSAAGVLLEYEP